MRLSELYHLATSTSDQGKRARQVLSQRHWFSRISDFDPRTGESLTQGLHIVLGRIATNDENLPTRDRLWRLVEHSRESVVRLLKSLTEEPRRREKVMPVRAVRELSISSFIALTKRPGRTTREKLSGKPYLQAVQKFQSIDLLQNQLLKEYVIRISELLELREELLGESDDLLDDLQRWLHSDSVSEISQWKNLPPNNTLLEHRDYRRVWDSWRWLQSLDQQLASDFSSVEDRQVVIEAWENRADAYSTGKSLFGEMPVIFDYDNFIVTTWSEVMQKSVKPFSRKAKRSELTDSPVCVDLSYIKPRWASESTKRRQTLTDKFVWQRWKDDARVAEILICGGDAAVLRDDVTTIFGPQTLMPDTSFGDVLETAVSAFIQRLGECFKGEELTWLVPDLANDFEITILRRNLNAHFGEAVPLPRSVAAANEIVGYPSDLTDGYRILIVDKFGETVFATPLTARHDAELESRLPDTRGFYWERSPHIVISADKSETYRPTELNFYDNDGNWHNAAEIPSASMPNPKTIETSAGLGKFDQVRVIAGSPVEGGVEMQRLQRIAGDIPLWRDHIPELAIKVMDGRRYSPFELVGRETVIRPIRGVPVQIPIHRRFLLPSGRRRYQFPLAQGQAKGEFGFVATLESPQFPLSTDLECALRLTYTYGSDDPYQLTFEPVDGTKAIHAKWKPKSMIAVSDAPGPEFPPTVSWTSLQEFPKGNGSGTSDLLDWVMSGVKRLLEDLEALKDSNSPSRAIGVITGDWRINARGNRFTFADIPSGNSVYINEHVVAKKLRDLLKEGDTVHLVVGDNERGLAATSVAASEGQLVQLIHASTLRQLRKVLRFPCIKIWDSARRLADADCPESFRRVMRRNITQLEDYFLRVDIPNDLRDDLKYLMCCWHSEVGDETTRIIADEVLRGTIFNSTAIGFVLGSLSQPWQREILDHALEQLDEPALEVLAGAIWRNEGFVMHLDTNTVFSITHKITRVLEDETRQSRLRQDRLFSCSRYCELLLGLLRTRDSSDENLRLIFQPNSPITREVTVHVENLSRLVVAQGLSMQSYSVKFDNLPEKPAGDNTPDLLFALKLYLSGDIGADAIRISAADDDVY